MTINLGDKKKVVTFKTNGVTNCLELCKMILRNYGLKSYGSSSNVHKLMYENNGELVYYGDDAKTNYKHAVECIDRHLSNNRPIIVGINHTIGRGINDGTTDHFIVVYGREIDNETNSIHYLYYEVGRGALDDVYNDNLNRLVYVEGDEPEFYDLESNRSDKKRFDVIQVRPNDGILDNTIHQNG
jgi:hypothetical protein